MGKKSKNGVLESKKKSDAKKAKKKSKKRQATELTEEEQVIAVEHYLAEAVRDPEKIASSPIVLVCAAEVPEYDPEDDDGVDIEGDEEMGREFLKRTMPPTERNTLLWAQPIEEYLPEEATKSEISRLMKFIKNLRHYTGRNIVLTIEYSPEETFVSDRPILTTNRIKSKEFLNNLITPFGMFGFVELLTDTSSGKIYGRYYAQISVSVLTEMGAKFCSTALAGSKKLTAPWVTKSKIDYPPQRTSYYEPGTKAMEDAIKFWSMFYRGEIMGPDCPEAEVLQSMLLSDETPAVRLYEGTSGLQIIDPDVFLGEKVQVLDDIELSDLNLATKIPKKVLFGKKAIAWAQEQLDIALGNYYDSWHVREYVVEFPDVAFVTKRHIVGLKVTKKHIVSARFTEKASL